MYNLLMFIKANAKVNFYLKVYPKTGEKHPLESIFFPLYDLYDEIEISKADTLSCQTIGADIPEEDNLCYRIARDFGKYKIVIKKNIPLGAGLGGGSSDAAAVLLAINELEELNFPKGGLARIASKYGADIPFFIYNEPSLVTGFGEKIQPIEYMPFGKKLTLYTNKYHSSTKDVYAEFDRQLLKRKKATNQSAPSLLCLLLIDCLRRDIRVNPKIMSQDILDYDKRFGELCHSLHNDLQEPCFALNSQIKKLYDAIPTPYKLLSGSGSSFFTLTENEFQPFKHEELVAYEFSI